MDASQQANLFQLKDPDSLPSHATSPQYIKQRTEEWHALRNQATVTGNTMHNALGLRGLKAAQEFHDVRISKSKPAEIPEELRKLFEHGTKNEPNALATLVGRVVPVFYPAFDFVEEGCYIIPGKNSTSFAEVHQMAVFGEV